MKITSLEESADFATLDIEKLFSKLKSYELSRKGRRTMMLLLLVSLLLLVLVLVAMWLTPPTLLTHLLWSLSCSLWSQLLMSSMRAYPMMRSPCL
jgi:O-antigen/teichoic acid export membrane protein